MSSPPDTADSTEKNDPSAIDWDELKRRMREAIRAVIQEDADELGISYAACVERYFGTYRHQDGGDDLPPSASSQ